MYRPMVLVGLLFCFAEVRGQRELTPPKAELKVLTGISTFSGDPANNCQHTVAGGAIRLYVAPQISVEPEVLFMWRGVHDRDFIFTPHVALDLMDPRRRVVPYLIAGIGVENHRDQIQYFDFFHDNRLVTERVSGNSVSANAGAGVKIFLTDRLFVAPEVRGGHEPHFRATVSIGYVFKGRRS